MGGIFLIKEDPFTKRVFECIKFPAGITRDEIWDSEQNCAVINQIAELYYHKYFYWLTPVAVKLGFESIPTNINEAFVLISDECKKRITQ